MKPFHIELNEELHLYLRDGKPLFAGTPDQRRTYPKLSTTIVLDRKMGRNQVQPADVNMQLRAYLAMIPAAEVESEIPVGYSEDFRPSSLLRLCLCPGSLALERGMASQGLSEPDPSEDAAEGTRLHRALSEPNAPRSDLTPEQLETVEKAERMEHEFIDFVLASNPVLPFYGAIIQPRISNKADVCFYTEQDIARAKTEINDIWDRAHEANAPRNASADACRFCPAKTVCPEYKTWVLAVEKVRHLPVGQWTDEQMALFEDRRGELQRFIDAAHEQIKAIKAACPERLPDWELVEGDRVRHVTDLPAAWVALSDTISAKQFSAACKLSMGGIEEVIWQARRNSNQPLTQREAKALVNLKLTGLIELKQKAPSLVRKKNQ